MEKIKGIFVTVGGALMSALGILAVPVGLMILCNIIDYATGLAASKYRNEPIDSYKGMRGIIKKVSMWLLVAIGAIIDELIFYATATVGINMPFTFLVSCIVAIWIVVNEIISILENINDIGVQMPPFLMPIVSRIKTQIEDKANVVNEESEDE